MWRKLSVPLILSVFIISSLYLIQRWSMSYDGSIRYELNKLQIFDKKYHLCVITRVQNVPSLIPEWIEYNLLIGVNHFYVINDCSDKDNGTTEYWLEFYRLQGVVTYTDNKRMGYDCNNQTLKYFENKLLNYNFHQSRDHCEWMTALDPDEYIVPTRENVSLLSVMASHHEPYIRIPWNIMGSTVGTNVGNILENQLNQSKLSTFLCGEMASHMKSVVKSNEVRSWIFSHHPRLYDKRLSNKYLSVNETWLLQPFEFNLQVDSRTNQSCKYPRHGLSIRHYYHLSFEEFMKTRGIRTLGADGTLMNHVAEESVEGKRKIWSRQGNYSHCNQCDSYGNDYSLAMDKQLTKSVLVKYRVYENKSIDSDILYHIFRGVPFLN